MLARASTGGSRNASNCWTLVTFIGNTSQARTHTRAHTDEYCCCPAAEEFVMADLSRATTLLQQFKHAVDAHASGAVPRAVIELQTQLKVHEQTALAQRPLPPPTTLLNRCD